MSLSDAEYLALRQTIAARGTARMVLFPATVVAWAAVAGLAARWGPVTGPVIALTVLTAGFEAVHALHTGAERIGRYLQVFYEGRPGGPAWETTAMAVGPALPGGGVDPLFTVVFAAAVAVNLATTLASAATRVELTVVGVLHAAAIVRLVRARGAAARQRAVELESYRAIHSRMTGEGPA